MLGPDASSSPSRVPVPRYTAFSRTSSPVSITPQHKFHLTSSLPAWTVRKSKVYTHSEESLKRRMHRRNGVHFKIGLVEGSLIRSSCFSVFRVFSPSIAKSRRDCDDAVLQDEAELLEKYLRVQTQQNLIYDLHDVPPILDAVMFQCNTKRPSITCFLRNGSMTIVYSSLSSRTLQCYIAHLMSCKVQSALHFSI